jgi:3-hydroxyisobutyrate dehydrogenase-like beta-hydroxyacid dehydrogenase
MAVPAAESPDRLEAGVVGLGAMGAPIARHLLAAGRRVGVTDLDPATVAELAGAGARPFRTAAELAAAAPVVFLLVPTADDVLAATLGEAGAARGAGPGTVLVVCSSVRPDTCARVAAGCPAGVDVLDAALTGGARAAEAGTVTLLVGGDPAVLDRIRPALSPWTRAAHLLGPLGAGQVGKTVNNLLHWAQIAAITEALELGRRLGVPVPALRAALQDGPTDSRTLRELQHMRLTWHAKDLATAAALAAEVGWPTPMAEAARAAMPAISVPALARLLAGEDPGLGRESGMDRGGHDVVNKASKG